MTKHVRLTEAEIEEIKRLAREEGMFTSQIAEATGRPQSTVRKLLRDAGLTHDRKIRPDQCEEVIRLRSEGVPISRIAATLKIGESTVRAIVRKAAKAGTIEETEQQRRGRLSAQQRYTAALEKAKAERRTIAREEEARRAWIQQRAEATLAEERERQEREKAAEYQKAIREAKRQKKAKEQKVLGFTNVPEQGMKQRPLTPCEKLFKEAERMKRKFRGHRYDAVMRDFDKGLTDAEIDAKYHEWGFREGDAEKWRRVHDGDISPGHAQGGGIDLEALIG